jgi:hypothetical protein
VDAFATAVAAIAARQDPEIASKTAEFLGRYAQLVETQPLEQEHAARLHYLRGQAREGDIRRIGLQLRIGYQLFSALARSFGSALTS